MKNLLFAIGLIAAAHSGAALATAQAPEKLIIEGETYGLFSNPLASYSSAQNSRPKLDADNSGLWRGLVNCLSKLRL